MINLIPIGSRVELIDREMRVVGIAIRGQDHSYVLYECTWFEGGNVHSGWFNEFELQAGVTKIQIGFVK